MDSVTGSQTSSLTEKDPHRRVLVGCTLALLVAAPLAACGSSDAEPEVDNAAAASFWQVAEVPGAGAAAVQSGSYDDLRSLASGADLVLRAQTGAVRQGPSFGTNDPQGVSLIVELEPLELLAGDHPSTEPIGLLLPVGLEGDVDLGEQTRQLEAADSEEAIYFLRSGSVLADIQVSEQNEKLRGLYLVQTNQAIMANHEDKAVFPGIPNYERESDPVASELDGKPYAEAVEQVAAEVLR